MIRVSINIVMPDNRDELFACLNALRRWESARSEIVMTIGAHAPNLSVADLQAVLDGLDPPLPYNSVIKLNE